MIDERQQESVELLLKAALDEVATLPPRKDWTSKARLVTSHFVVAFFSLFGGVGFGIALTMMEPANVHLPITLVGVVLGVTGVGFFFYFLARGLFFSLRRFDPKSVFEYCLPAVLTSKDQRGHKAFTSLMLPSARERYAMFYDVLQKTCTRELTRRGGGFLTCKRWKVESSPAARYATCRAELARTHQDSPPGSLNTQVVDEPLAEVSLYCVQSSAKNWYLLFPDLQATKDGLRFLPR